MLDAATHQELNFRAIKIAREIDRVRTADMIGNATVHLAFDRHLSQGEVQNVLATYEMKLRRHHVAGGLEVVRATSLQATVRLLAPVVFQEARTGGWGPADNTGPANPFGRH